MSLPITTTTNVDFKAPFDAPSLVDAKPSAFQRISKALTSFVKSVATGIVKLSNNLFKAMLKPIVSFKAVFSEKNVTSLLRAETDKLSALIAKKTVITAEKRFSERAFIRAQDTQNLNESTLRNAELLLGKAEHDYKNAYRLNPGLGLKRIVTSAKKNVNTAKAVVTNDKATLTKIMNDATDKVLASVSRLDKVDNDILNQQEIVKGLAKQAKPTTTKEDMSERLKNSVGPTNINNNIAKVAKKK